MEINAAIFDFGFGVGEWCCLCVIARSSALPASVDIP
jgi:hypothetical protein